MMRSRPPKGAALITVFLLEPAWRPVVLRRIAAAGAVERGNVLERDEDVTVQLDVRHVLDVAIGGQDTLLVLAAEKRDLDLLAFVLVGVVLHRPEGSRSAQPTRLPQSYLRLNPGPV